MATIDSQDHSERNQRALLGYVDREAAAQASLDRMPRPAGASERRGATACWPRSRFTAWLTRPWQLLASISRLIWKQPLVVAVLLWALPAFADIPSLDLGGGYTAYDCGSGSSAAYQACQNAMALGESEFLATYTPTGSPLPANWQGLLPPASGDCYGAQASSPDGLSDVILLELGGSGCGDPEDSYPVYIWHDSGFIDFYEPQIDICPSCGASVQVNDQGYAAAVSPPYNCAFVEDLGCVEQAFSDLDPGWELPAHGFLSLNDDDQALFLGIDGSTDSLDSILVDPPGAPIPGVPEPSSYALLGTALILAVPLLRKAYSRATSLATSSAPHTTTNNYVTTIR